jgi:hypothetical protein
MKKSLLLIIVLLLNLHCKDSPTEEKHDNRSPGILSLSVIPDVIGPSDSVTVTCKAVDPDGDTLVYDWITDGRSRIKGANSYWDLHLYNTFENSRIFYPNNLNDIPIDTLWVQCFARDRKGKSDNKLIYFLLKK